jgi:hypothetical protein
MANFKVTWFFENVSKGVIGASAALGWTETWYLGNQTGNIDTVFNHPDILAYTQLRLAILHTSSRIPFLRVSDDNNPRLVKIQSLTAKVGEIVGGNGSREAQIQCAILVDLQRLPLVPNLGEPVHHRRFLIRGLSQGLINGNVLDPSSPRWKDLIAFLNFIGVKLTGNNPALNVPLPLTRTALGIRYHDPNQQWTYGMGIVTAGIPNSRIIVTPPILGLATSPNPSLIQIEDVPAPQSRMNRIWTFLGYDDFAAPTKMTLGKTRKPLGTDAVAAGGAQRMRRVSWLYGPIDQYAIIGLRSKKTGRLFRQLRGRSSNRG